MSLAAVSTGTNMNRQGRELNTRTGKAAARRPPCDLGRLLAAALLSVLLTGAAGADRIILLNGIRVTGAIVRADRQGLDILVAAGRQERQLWRDVYSVRTDALPGEKEITGGSRNPAAAAEDYLRLEGRLAGAWQRTLTRRRAVVLYQRAGLASKALETFLGGEAGGPDSVRFAEIPIFEPGHAQALLKQLAQVEKGRVSPHLHALILGLRADLLIALNRLDEAEGVVRTLLAATDSAATGLGRIRSARIARARGDKDRALALLEAAGRELGVAFQGDVGYWRARILLEEGHREEAILSAMEVALRYGFLEDRAPRCLHLVIGVCREDLRFREAASAEEMLKTRYPWFPRRR